MAEWKWYVARSLGFGDCAFEANMEDGAAEFAARNVTIIMQTPRGVGLVPWLPAQSKWCENHGVFRKSDLTYWTDAVEQSFRDQLVGVWNKVKQGQNGVGIIPATAVDLDRLKKPE